MFKMCVSSSSMLFLFSLTIIMLFPLSITCFDITKLLSQYPEYSSYSNYLTQTQLATEINGRTSLTVLAVDNSGMAPISGKPMDVIKKILSIHVLLEYYDVKKFQSMKNQNLTVTTLFQTTGQAKGMNGFMKFTDLSTGAVTFTSPSDPNGAGANLVKEVVTQLYNISVLQISTLIMPPSLLPSSNATSHAPAPAPVVSPVPVESPVPETIPFIMPVPEIAPVPVVSPVAGPVKSPVPVVSPVPVSAPVAAPAPVPVKSPGPVPVISPAEAADKSGVMKSVANNALALFLTFSSIYVLLSTSTYNAYS